MNTWFSSNIITIDQLKIEYRKLCFKHHPDMGGSTENMQVINAEYEAILKAIINRKDDKNYTDKSTFHSKDDEFVAEQILREVLEKIIILDGLTIEIVGLWLYVSGETQKHKEALKGAGLKWNSTRKQWVYVGTKSRGRSNMDMDQIREKYGSHFVKNTGQFSVRKG